jgi:hypothetical protein
MRDGDLIPVSRDYLKYEYLTATVPVKVEINTRTGVGKFYDPFDPDRYFYPFDLGAAVGSGSYFTLRTNSVSLSVDNVKITKLN